MKYSLETKVIFDNKEAVIKKTKKNYSNGVVVYTLDNGKEVSEKELNSDLTNEKKKKTKIKKAVHVENKEQPLKTEKSFNKKDYEKENK